MVCDASRSSKLQENGRFHSIAGPGLKAALNTHDALRWSKMLPKVLNRRKMADFIALPSRVQRLSLIPVMICDASRNSKSHENGQFHGIAWQGLEAALNTRDDPRWSVILLEAQNRRKMADFIASYGKA